MKTALFSAFVIILSAFQANAHEEMSAASLFPKEISIDHEGKQYQLGLTGVSTRKKFFVKVYNVASYLQKDALQKGDILNSIMQGNAAKQLTIRWVHNATSNQVRAGYEESFKKVMGPSDDEALHGDLEKFLSFFNVDVSKGDEFILRWLPGGSVDVIIDGQKAGSIRNEAFAKKLWEIWFGNQSVVNRNELLSQAQ